MKFKIRKLTLKDLSQLLKLLNTSIQEDFPEYQPRIFLVYRDHIFNKKFFIRFLKNKDNIIFGAFHNNKLVGFTNVWSQWGGVAEVNWLVVGKQFRSKGVGTLLLHKIEEWASKTHKHYLFLHTETGKNVEFYKKRGYEYVGLQRSSWFGADEHLMQKILRDKPFEEIFEKYLKKK